MVEMFNKSLYKKQCKIGPCNFPDWRVDDKLCVDDTFESKEELWSFLLTWKYLNYILWDFIFMLNHYFILCKSALFTKEHYVLAYYKIKCISLCSLKHPWKSIGALLLFCCGGVHLKMQIRGDQSEALKPEPCQPIRSSKTWATLSAVIPSYTEPPITSYFSDWSSFLYILIGSREGTFVNRMYSATGQNKKHWRHNDLKLAERRLRSAVMIFRSTRITIAQMKCPWTLSTAHNETVDDDGGNIFIQVAGDPEIKRTSAKHHHFQSPGAT